MIRPAAIFVILAIIIMVATIFTIIYLSFIFWSRAVFIFVYLFLLHWVSIAARRLSPVVASGATR